VFVLDNNMINIKINTLRVKVIAFGAQSIIMVVIIIARIIITGSLMVVREMVIMTTEAGF